MKDEKPTRRQYPKKPRSRRNDSATETLPDLVETIPSLSEQPAASVETEITSASAESTDTQVATQTPQENTDRQKTAVSTSSSAQEKASLSTPESSVPEGNTDSLPTFTPEEATELLQQTKRPYAEWLILSDNIKRAIAEYGYINPTPVQTVAIEPALDLNDMVVQAKTGTGKTAAFGIPLLERLEPQSSSPRALILTPTRELAGQVATELQSLGKYTGLQIHAVYGGTSIQNQIENLESGTDIVVGTPGRLLDHIRRKTLLVDAVESIVLDEADEMLSMGFYLEVSSVIDACKNRKQIMLFSATVPPDIEGLIRQYTNKPVRLMVSGGDRRVTGIKHIGYFIQDDLPRPRNLLYVLEHDAPGSAIIFCNRRDDTSMLAAYLSQHGKSAEAIHGEMNQSERERVLQKLRNGELQYMVATDVASRGIDISGLSHVINYNFPHTLDLYIHRVGRTGRQGREGTAISLLSGEDLGLIVHLKRIHKIYFDICELPSTDQVIQLAASRHIGLLFERSVKEIIESYLPLADAMQVDPRGRYIFAYFLKKYHEEDAKSEAAPKTPEPVLPAESAPSRAKPQPDSTPTKPSQTSPPPQSTERPAPTSVPTSTETTSATAAVSSHRADRRSNTGTPAEATPTTAAVPTSVEEKPRTTRPTSVTQVALPPDNDNDNDGDGDGDDESPTQDIGEPTTPDHVRLYINIGSLEGFQAESLTQLISNELSLSPTSMTAIHVEKHHSFLNTDLETSEKILAGFQERKVGDFLISAEIARKPRRRRRR